MDIWSYHPFGPIQSRKRKRTNRIPLLRGQWGERGGKIEMAQVGLGTLRPRVFQLQLQLRAPFPPIRPNPNILLPSQLTGTTRGCSAQPARHPWSRPSWSGRSRTPWTCRKSTAWVGCGEVKYLQPKVLGGIIHEKSELFVPDRILKSYHPSRMYRHLWLQHLRLSL